MKWRNQLLALFCLLVFAALGVLYFEHWVVQKPFGIILFIGEGLSPERLAMTRVYSGGADTRLSLDSMESLALLRNYSNDFAAPDQAAAATALATGVRVNNHAIGIGADGKALRNLVELARESGRATGLITNANLTDPTAAAFYAHANDQTDRATIALALLNGDLLDIAMGGGAANFLPESKQGRRYDGRDLLLELRRNGFDIVRSKAELEAIPRWRRPRLMGVFNDAELSYAGHIAAGRDEPSLADMVRRAIELLQFNPKGYLLVVDAGLMRKAAQGNDGERTLSETVELDRAVRLARNYSGPKSTILVAGDCAIGGLNLNGFPFRKDSGVALLGLNSGGYPWFTWATGPLGEKSYGPAKVKSPNEQISPANPVSDPHRPTEPAAIYSQEAMITVDDVLAFGSGPATEGLRGVVDSTEVFAILRDDL